MKSLICVCIILCLASTLEAQRKVVCYWGTWSVYRSGNAKFEVGQINPRVCTHIIYSFFGLRANGEVYYMDPYLDLADNWGRNNIGQFMALKNINPNVKLMAAFGGWTFGSGPFSQMAGSSSSRSNFATSAKNFLSKHGFDGIDLDWEYPNQREGSSSADKQNLILLLQQLRSTLGSKLITIAVGATRMAGALSYNIPEIAKYVDFVNLMTYDLHGAWDGVTGINSPLYKHPSESNAELNVDACVKYWLSSGCPREKLILGIPTYGRTFTLANSGNNGVGAPATGPGNAGSFVGENSFLAYNEICSTINSWTRRWEDTQKVPYAFKGNQWVGYDDLDSLPYKLNYILANNLGGAMFWSIETDDFGNICGRGAFPLISMAYSYMGGQVGPTNPTQPPTNPTNPTNPPVTNPPVTNPPGGQFSCPGDGIFANPNDCTKFYQCAHGTAYSMDCPGGLHFNKATSNCDWPANANCK